MDPFTQGALGAALPQSVSNKEKLKTTTWLGCLAGMSPDIDVLIQSPTDPLLFLEFHRQFTHSLVFIPLGALICSLLFYRWSKQNLNFKQTYLVCLLAYATHALLDACTTYGTQLFWPFSDIRIAWNNVSVVDPLVTLPLIAFVCAAMFFKKPLLARFGLAWVVSYLLLGVVQNKRAEALGLELAHSRGHEPTSISAKPGFANLILWKIIYEFDDRYYVDAIRVGFDTKTYPGDSIAKLNIKQDFPWLDPNSQQARDIDRFAWFSGNYLALDKNNDNLIIDMRYSILPNEVKALWGIRLNPDAGNQTHIEYYTDRNTSAERMNDLILMLKGESYVSPISL